MGCHDQSGSRRSTAAVSENVARTIDANVLKSGRVKLAAQQFPARGFIERWGCHLAETHLVLDRLRLGAPCGLQSRLDRRFAHQFSDGLRLLRKGG
jgi:hypothetical protein